MAGGDESVATIIAFAAEDGDSIGAWIFVYDEAGDGRPRVLHQGGRGYAELLGGEPVDFAHLAGGEYLHSALDAIANEQLAACWSRVLRAGGHHRLRLLWDYT